MTQLIARLVIHIKHTLAQHRHLARCRVCIIKQGLFIFGHESEKGINVFRRSLLFTSVALSGPVHVEVHPLTCPNDSFTKFVETVIARMNPFPQQNSVLIFPEYYLVDFSEVEAIAAER